MKEIPLTQGKVALVDDEDFEAVSTEKWWCHRTSGINYVERRVGNSHQSLHRFLMNPPENMEIDHINGDGLDNRRCNLRIVTTRGNGQNRHQNKTSKYPGVCLNTGRGKKWRSYISVNGKWKTLGLYDSEDDAATVYRVACAVLGGGT